MRPDEPLHTVHRIKIDEPRKLVITTHHNGGLHVIDLDSAQLLFELPSVRRCVCRNDAYSKVDRRPPFRAFGVLKWVPHIRLHGW